MPPTAPVYGEKRHGYIDSLIYWRDPKTSAGVLAAGLGFFALTIVFRYSYTALACMFFLVHLLVSVSACSRVAYSSSRPLSVVLFRGASSVGVTRAAGGQAIYSFVQHWNGKKVSDWTRPLKIDKDEAAKIALRVALDFNAAVDWYFGLAAARDLGTLGLVLVVLFAMWTVATLFSDSGLCLIGERCARATLSHDAAALRVCLAGFAALKWRPRGGRVLLSAAQ